MSAARAASSTPTTGWSAASGSGAAPARRANPVRPTASSWPGASAGAIGRSVSIEGSATTKSLSGRGAAARSRTASRAAAWRSAVAGWCAGALSWAAHGRPSRRGGRRAFGGGMSVDATWLTARASSQAAGLPPAAALGPPPPPSSRCGRRRSASAGGSRMVPGRSSSATCCPRQPRGAPSAGCDRHPLLGSSR